MTPRNDTPKARPLNERLSVCSLFGHKEGLMRIYRGAPSIVYGVRCYRCGKVLA